MLAELPDGGELRVMGTLAKLIRLSVGVRGGRGIDHDRRRSGRPRRQTSVALRAPSWKVDALLEVLSASGPASRWSRSRRRGN